MFPHGYPPHADPLSHYEGEAEATWNNQPPMADYPLAPYDDDDEVTIPLWP